jgi:DNA mismatch repair protein MutL
MFTEKHSISQHIFTGTHIVLMQKELTIIHASRARQRIMYDQLMQSFMLQPIASQQLLFPIEKEVNKKELLIWESNQKNLNRIGFSWKAENDTLHISGIPSCVREVEAMTCIDELLIQLTNAEIEPGEIAHTLINTLAFSASRTKIDLYQADLRAELLEKLFESKEHNHTPNGLKIITSLTIDELNARF